MAAHRDLPAERAAEIAAAALSAGHGRAGDPRRDPAARRGGSAQPGAAGARLGRGAQPIRHRQGEPGERP